MALNNFSSSAPRRSRRRTPRGGSAAGDITTEQLLLMAQMQGGSIGQIAEELTHPERSILSTAGEKFKNAFKGFIDIVSTPGHIIAGLASKELTVAEAMEQNVNVSDVIFGDTNIFDKDGDPSTLAKIGDFIVRLPVDILTDPLTYLTFGASAGFAGIKSLGKVSLGVKGAKAFGKEAGEKAVKEGFVTKSLTQKGTDVEQFIRAYERQITGTQSAKELAKSGKDLGKLKAKLIEEGVEKETLDQSQKILKAMLKDTVEAPLDIDNAKKTMSRLFENNPALVSTYIDKGGIKYFGKTLLSSQRSDAFKKMIPGMTLLDKATLPIRNSVMSVFDPALVKVDGVYKRLPEEFLNMKTKMKNLGDSMGVDLVRNLSNVQRQLNLNQAELDIITSALSVRKIPSDPRLAKAYTEFLGINEAQLELFKRTGKPIHNLEGYTGLIWAPTNTKKVSINSGLSAKIGAAQEAQHAKFVKVADKPIAETSDEFAQLIGQTDNILKEKLSKARSVDEAGRIIGDEVDKIVKAGDTVEGGLKKTEALRALRKQIDDLADTKQIVGRTDELGFKPAELEQIRDLGLDAVEGKYFVNNENKIFKRVATTAQELKEAGIEGFDTNLLTATMTRGMQNIQQAMGQNFAEGLVRNFSKLADEAPDSWVKLSSAITDDKLAQKYGSIFAKDGQEVLFHPAVAKQFENMLKATAGDEVTSAFWKNYDRLLSYWKGSVTTLFPMFHGRNSISNVFLNMLDLGVEAFNPKTFTMSVDMLNKGRKLNGLLKRMAGTGDDVLKATKEYDELLRTKMFTDNAGYEWTFGELHKVAKDNDIAFSPNLTGPLDVRNDREGLANFFGLGTKSKKRRALDKLNPLEQEQFIPLAAGREVGRTIEGHARLTNFMANLRKTGDVTHATTRTKQFLFDYANLTPFEKTTMRRLIPFYTFTRKNLELQFKSFLSAPGRTAAQVKFTKAVGDVLGGEELTDEEAKLLPPWLKNSINLKRKADGGFTQILTGFGTPLEQPFQQFGGTQIEGSLSPLIKFPLERLTGYDFFRGKPISDVTNAKNFKRAPQAVKDFIGYVEYEGTTSTGEKYKVQVALRPERMHSINNLPFVGRTMATLGNIQDENVETGLKVLQGLTGIRADTIDFARQQELKDEETLQALEKLLKDAGVRGQFTRGYNRKNTRLLEN